MWFWIQMRDWTSFCEPETQTSFNFPRIAESHTAHLQIPGTVVRSSRWIRLNWSAKRWEFRWLSSLLWMKLNDKNTSFSRLKIWNKEVLIAVKDIFGDILKIKNLLWYRCSIQLYNYLRHSLLSPFRMVCRDFTLPETASYVSFFAYLLYPLR